MSGARSQAGSGLEVSPTFAARSALLAPNAAPSGRRRCVCLQRSARGRLDARRNRTRDGVGPGRHSVGRSADGGRSPRNARGVRSPTGGRRSAISGAGGEIGGTSFAPPSNSTETAFIGPFAPSSMLIPGGFIGTSEPSDELRPRLGARMSVDWAVMVIVGIASVNHDALGNRPGLHGGTGGAGLGTRRSMGYETNGGSAAADGCPIAVAAAASGTTAGRGATETLAASVLLDGLQRRHGRASAPDPRGPARTSRIRATERSITPKTLITAIVRLPPRPRVPIGATAELPSPR